MSERAYVEGTVESYLNKLASADPEPGGGSAAALAGALGAALISMVTNLTLGKEKFAAVQDDVAGLKNKSEALRAELEELVTLDALAYRAVAAAMKMPKDTDEQKEQRRQVMQVALKGAAEVPLKVAEAAVEVARLSLPAAEKGNPNAVSDAGVAVLLADAAAHSAALNARINLVWIEDEDMKRGTWARIEAILSETGRMRDVVLAVTYSKIW
ncbi:MAG: cyclodeaminase/cyclohydrolase family protein [Thermoleophilia bacterium]|nr:cyclodeaminase/cyclohydrolase family protein [Thermoleophilia bacterium]